MRNDEHTELERSLAEGSAPDAATWERVRGDLADAAELSGLIDVAFEHHETPLGTIVVGATRDGLVRIGLPSEDSDDVLQQLAERVSPRVLRASRDSLVQTRRQLDEYFGHERRLFEIPLDWRLTTGFRRDVLRATEQIPYGQTASYRDVATRAGSPNAVRRPARRSPPTPSRSWCRATASCAPAAASASTEAARRPRRSSSPWKAPPDRSNGAGPHA